MTFFAGCATEAEAFELAPWAAEVVEVDCGFLAFETVTEAEIWRNQK